jgi:hypothetical protein
MNSIDVLEHALASEAQTSKRQQAKHRTMQRPRRTSPS